MDPVFKKLNFKSQSDIVVLDAPESFNQNLEAMSGLTKFHFDLQSMKEVDFVIAFVTKQSEINELVPELYDLLSGDAVVWFCYPKGSSRKYTCDFNRDNGWQILGDFGMEGVRMVAIDEDWSALRFRKVEFIKKMKRRESFALSNEGKKKAEQKGK